MLWIVWRSKPVSKKGDTSGAATLAAVEELVLL